jgi:acetylornithine deacetylase
VIWARITLSGPARHASHADEAAHPVDAAFAVVSALRELAAELNADPEPEFSGVARPYLLNVGALHAGDWPSMTPGEAVLDVRLGFPIRMEPRAMQRRVAEVVGRADRTAEIEFRGFRARGYAFDEASPLVRLLGDCHEELHGTRPAPKPARATTDLRFFDSMPGVCYGPVGDNLHGVDEWVDLESVADVATVLAVLLRRWMVSGA